MFFGDHCSKDVFWCTTETKVGFWGTLYQKLFLGNTVSKDFCRDHYTKRCFFWGHWIKSCVNVFWGPLYQKLFLETIVLKDVFWGPLYLWNRCFLGTTVLMLIKCFFGDHCIKSWFLRTNISKDVFWIPLYQNMIFADHCIKRWF